MADKALSLAQRVVVILRGPTGGMLACLLTASLLGGVAAAHPGGWANAPGQQPSQAGGQQEASAAAPQTMAVAVRMLGALEGGMVLGRRERLVFRERIADVARHRATGAVVAALLNPALQGRYP